MSIFRAVARAGVRTGGVVTSSGWGAAKASYGIGKIGLKGAVMGGQLGAKAGLFAMRNPMATLGMVGAGLGFASLAGSGLPDSALTTEQRMGYAERMGSSYIDQAFQGSAEGLVQGLHAGRHK